MRIPSFLTTCILLIYSAVSTVQVRVLGVPLLRRESHLPSESSRCASIKEGVTSSFISSRREVLKKSNPFLHNFIFLFMEHFYKHINTFYFPPLKNPLLTHKICYYVLKSLLSSFLSLFSAPGTLSLLWLLKHSRHMPMC